MSSSIQATAELPAGGEEAGTLEAIDGDARETCYLNGRRHGELDLTSMLWTPHLLSIAAGGRGVAVTM
jgi:hypothetical protein